MAAAAGGGAPATGGGGSAAAGGMGGAGSGYPPSSAAAAAAEPASSSSSSSSSSASAAAAAAAPGSSSSEAQQQGTLASGPTAPLDLRGKFTALDWLGGEHEGVLQKQGHFVRNWKSRWFIAKGDRLFYFRAVPAASRAAAAAMGVPPNLAFATPGGGSSSDGSGNGGAADPAKRETMLPGAGHSDDGDDDEGDDGRVGADAGRPAAGGGGGGGGGAGAAGGAAAGGGAAGGAAAGAAADSDDVDGGAIVAPRRPGGPAGGAGAAAPAAATSSTAATTGASAPGTAAAAGSPAGGAAAPSSGGQGEGAAAAAAAAGRPASPPLGVVTGEPRGATTTTTTTSSRGRAPSTVAGSLGVSGEIRGVAQSAYERMKRSVRSSLNLDGEDERPVGVVFLKNAIITKMGTTAVPGHPHCIEICETANELADNRIYLISADRKEDLDEWLTKLTEKGKGLPASFEVGHATFKHTTHVAIDASGKLSGLPPEWEAILAQSGISPEEERANPRAVYQALAFQNRWNSTVVKDSDHVKPVPMADSASVPDLQDLINPADPYDYYQGMEKIGKGAFGAVHAATDLRTGDKVAIKKMQVTKKNLKYIVNELVNHRAMGVHPNVVRFLDSYFAENRLWVVLEFMARGNLTTYTDLHDTAPMTEPIISYFTVEILKALDFLHANNRIHRDIKTDNVLIDSEGHVKLADFGFAIELTKERSRRATVIGTPYWMAPEIILNQQYGREVDIWSLGIMVMELTDGQPPYMDLSTAKALFLISTEGVPELQGKQWSAELRHFLNLCLSMHVDSRPSCTELVQHPAFRVAATREQARDWMDAALAGEAGPPEKRACVLM